MVQTAKINRSHKNSQTSSVSRSRSEKLESCTNVSELPTTDRNAMRIYMQEIGKTPLLSKKEEIELAARIKSGDKDARDHMISANLRLVVKIAHDYNNFGLLC